METQWSRSEFHMKHIIPIMILKQDGNGVGFWKKGFSAVGEDGKVTYCNNGPCYGECANGERFRTQGVPKKSKELDYVHVMQVGQDTGNCRH